MGFSTVAATAIIGVSIVIAIEIFAGTMIPDMQNVHNSFIKMRERAIGQIQTDINITSVTGEINNSTYDINITIKNTGSITLSTLDFVILINGTKQSFTCSKEYLYPENVVYFNVLNFPDAGNQILKVVTNNGISDYYKFEI